MKACRSGNLAVNIGRHRRTEDPREEPLWCGRAQQSSQALRGVTRVPNHAGLGRSLAGGPHS